MTDKTLLFMFLWLQFLNSGRHYKDLIWECLKKISGREVSALFWLSQISFVFSSIFGHLALYNLVINPEVLLCLFWTI